MLYISRTSRKCLFCTKRCAVTKSNDLQESLLEEDTGSVDNDNPQKVEDKQFKHQSHEASREKSYKCSCCSSPERFLGPFPLDKVDTQKEKFMYVFVLRELLGYPKRKCIKYLKKLQQQKIDKHMEVSQDGWFSVCDTCTKRVEEGHKIYHEIERLSLQFDELKNGLKGLLVKTQEGVEDLGDQIDDGNGNEEESEEGDTLFAEVRDYFAPRQSSSPLQQSRPSVVKMEIDTPPELGDDDNLFDDLLTTENFDDGSDWAPSDEEVDGEDEIEAEESLDLKPNISDLNANQDGGKKGKKKGVTKETAAQGHNVANKVSKPGPKSRKERRLTRLSKRLSGKDPLRDYEEILPTIPEVDADISGDLETVKADFSKKRPKKQNVKESKSILSDSESESMTEPEESDDSDYDGKGKDKFACDICCAVYFTKHRLKEHEQLHSSDDAFKCDECQFVAATSRGLSMHLTKVHCKKINEKEVKMHKRKSSSLSTPSPKKKPKLTKLKPLKVGEYQCPLCPVSYQTAHRLKEHEEHHLNLRSDMIKCKHCNYVCLYERGMKIHVTKYHRDIRKEDEDSESEQEGENVEDSENNEGEFYSCDICNRTYKTSHRLREHKALHKKGDASKCSKCSYVCKSERGLVMHMRAEHGENLKKKEIRRFKRKPRVYAGDPQHCTLCPAKYYTHHRFRQHVNLHSSETNYPCEECGWVFSTDDKRDYHMKISHERGDIKIRTVVKTFRCSHCDASPFDQRCKYRDHLLLNHKDKVFVCNTCDQIYESQQLYDLHIEKCTKREIFSDDEDDEMDEDDEESMEKRKMFSCTQCKAKFCKQDSLNKHFSLKHSTETFPCTLCSKVFPTESRLRYHMARQHDKIQNVCKICGYKAHGASHLRLHMQKHTKERLFACELCGKTFVSPTYLTAHRQKDHFQELGLDPIKCSQCDLLFPNNSILKYHIQKIHEKKFKYFCEVCGKGFLFASGLKNHSAIHSTERTEVCQFCGASYVHNRVLMDHLKKHHPEEFAAAKGVDPSTIKVPAGINIQGPFLCKFCNIEFPSRWGLHNHLKSHTEVYDKFKCGICGKGYSSPAGVKRHEETAHVAAIHECDKCGKTFPCKDYLRYHIKNHCHKKDPFSQTDTAPIPSKHQKSENKDVKHDPHIVKEAGHLHIVTPGSSSHPAQNVRSQSQNAQMFSHSQIQGSGASSSSASYAAQVQQNANIQQGQLGDYPAACYRFL